MMDSTSALRVMVPNAESVSYSGRSVSPTGHFPSLTLYWAPHPSGHWAHAYFLMLYFSSKEKPPSFTRDSSPMSTAPAPPQFFAGASPLKPDPAVIPAVPYVLKALTLSAV